ncbi:MAG: hypothetical protein EA424_22435 [Planctomycetaceae bacterium]|nr:MAG: hypothetical protein EA424_22435 [Planctomycetaceae bacterium]
MKGYASTLFVSVFAPSEAFTICGRCAAEDHAKSLVSLAEADHIIEETTENLEELDELIKKCPQMPPLPEGLESIAVTPLSVYRTLQAYLAAFKSRRMEIIAEMESEQRLQYQIQKAVEAEDYELAAELDKQRRREE